MKKSIICALTAGILVTSAAPLFAQNGERVLFKNLPEPVKKTLRAQKGHEDIQRIEKVTQNGQTVYHVQFDRKGPNKLVMVEENGSLVSNNASGGAQADASVAVTQLKDLPQTVQQTFKRETSDARITDIDVVSARGTTVYDIEYSRGNRSGEIVINEDGTLHTGRLPRSIRDRDSRDDTAFTSDRRTDSTAGGTQNRFDRPLASTRKIDFESVPQAARQTIRQTAGSNRIEDVETGTLDGKTVFEVAFKSDGIHNEVRVDESGTVIQHISGATIRFPGAMTENEVPAPVRRAIREQVGSGEVNDIDKLTVSGKTVYEVGFKKEKGGAQQEVQIAEDGTVIREPAGADK